MLQTASIKHKTISLSVDIINPAVKLYERVWFRKYREVGDSMIMRYDVPESPFSE